MAEATGFETSHHHPAKTTDQHQQELETFPSSSDQPRAGFKKYYMEYTTSRLNARLHLGSMAGIVEYYLHTSLTITAPQLLLRRGDNKQAPVVAFCKFQNLSRHSVLGRGDYEKQPAEELVWEDLHREKNILRRSDYSFGTSDGPAAGAAGNGRAQYSWRKDRERLNRTVYDCVDEGGNVVARMASGGAFNWKRAGDIEIVEGLGTQLEEWLIIGATAIWAYESLAYQSLLQGFENDKDDKKKKK